MADSLAAALVELQGKLPTVEKARTGKVQSEKASYSYAYADLSDVSAAIMPVLSGAGLAFTAAPTLRDDGRFVLAYELIHASGESRKGEYPIPATGSAQQIGAAITYARRYALCAVTGLAPKGDDTDATNAPKTQRQKGRQQQSDQPSGNTTADDTPAAGAPRPMSGPQRGMVLALFDKFGVTDRDERLDVSRRVVGRDHLPSANALTFGEASRLIEWLKDAEAGSYSEAVARLDPGLGDVPEGQETLPVDDGRSPLARAQDKTKERPDGGG